VVFHIRYTAREGGNILKDKAKEYLDRILKNADKSNLFRLFSLRHDFPMEWHNFVSSVDDLKVTIKKDHFPYLTQSFKLKVNKIEIFSSKDGELETKDIDIPNNFGDEIHNNKKSELKITPDEKVLIRDKDKYVFLIFKYSLE